MKTPSHYFLFAERACGMDRDRWFPVHPAVPAWAEAPQLSLSGVGGSQAACKGSAECRAGTIAQESWCCPWQKSQDFHPTVLGGTLFSVGILPLGEWQGGERTCSVILLLETFLDNCYGDRWRAGWHTPSLFFKMRSHSLWWQQMRDPLGYRRKGYELIWTEVQTKSSISKHNYGRDSKLHPKDKFCTKISNPACLCAFRNNFTSKQMLCCFF